MNRRPPFDTLPDNADSEAVRRLARMLDAAITIPGTKITIGLDALLGLIPGAGDLVGSALSGYIVVAAAKMGVPKSVLARMVGNLALDTVVGSVPILGDLFDVAFRANMRNVALIEKHQVDPRGVRKQSRWVVAAIVGAVLLLAAGGIALVVLIIRALAGLM